MFRAYLLLVLTAAPLLTQTTPSSHHRKAPALASNDDKWLVQVSALESRAGQILKTELSRRIDPACDKSHLYATLSNAEYTRCIAADEVITQHNYQAFVDAVSASLSVQDPDADPRIFPPRSRNFAAAESAWRTYLEKTCAALGDIYEGGTGRGAAMSECQQNLTRQHMKDLNEIFLKR